MHALPAMIGPVELQSPPLTTTLPEEFGTVIEHDDDTNVDSEKELSLEQARDNEDSNPGQYGRNQDILLILKLLDRSGHCRALNTR
ncbi:hypothetical protein TNCV_2603661 [Trichonephila clavipes]|nr:hypothetical protein TNCV_2603661 [Trichonephila clavipes]